MDGSNIPGKITEAIAASFQVENPPNPHEVAVVIAELVEKPSSCRRLRRSPILPRIARQPDTVPLQGQRAAADLRVRLPSPDAGLAPHRVRDSVCYRACDALLSPQLQGRCDHAPQDDL
jgi:hypothetical protein